MLKMTKVVSFSLEGCPKIYPVKMVWKRGFIQLVLVVGILWMLLILIVLLFHVWSCQTSFAFFSGCPIPVANDPDKDSRRKNTR
ncbi:hypothetical protein SLE2022_199440 [Rubroshorea leprosula]